ncbi:LytTR family DNA-binding domain-containing protein [Streptococcus rifensis]
MKLTLNISDQVLEDAVTVDAKTYTEQVAQLVDFIKGLDIKAERLKAKRGEEVYLLDWEDIYRLVIEDKVVHVKTAKQDFTTAYRLYQVKEILPADFLQISQSEIINLKQLDHLQMTPNGLVKLILKNGDVTYSSRRYLRSIKEALTL